MTIRIERNGFMKLDLGTTLQKLCEKFCIFELTVRSELNHHFKFDEKYKNIISKCKEVKRRSPIFKSPNSYSGEGKVIPNSIKPYQVFIFLKGQLKCLNLDDVLLNSCNKSIFYKYCKYLISMAYKSCLSLSDICKSMKIRGEYNVYTLYELYVNVMSYILFYEFVIPILKLNFHWCESPANDSSVVYFTLSHWHEFQNAAGLYYISRGIFIGPINRESVKEIKNFNPGTARCLVKNLETGDYRLISNLKVKQSHNVKYSRKKTKIVDLKLLNLLEFFKSLKLKQPELITEDLYAPDSFEEIRKYRDRMNYVEKNKFYIVRADVKNCYESLRHQDLRSIFSDLISKTKDPEIIAKKSSLKSEFYDFLENIYVKFGCNYYHQKCGIPQGSHLSSYLCGIYMLHIKRKELSKFSNKDNVLFHQYVDDVLFISLSQTEAESFLMHLHKESPRVIPWLGYNLNDSCEVTLKVNNQLKTLSRFAGFPQDAQKSLNYLKLKLSYVSKGRAIIANSIHDNCCSEETINYNCELLGILSAYITLCRVRACLEPHELLSGTSSQKIAGLLKAFLYNYIEDYKLFEVALKSLKETLRPYKGQMKWILHYLCK